VLQVGRASSVLAWQVGALFLVGVVLPSSSTHQLLMDVNASSIMLQVHYSIGGSGSAYITGWCDKHFREDFTAEEAHAFVRQALTHAMARDSSSGGCIRTVTITSSGVKRDFLPGSQVPATFGELQTPQQRVTA
jgi:20S proteasome subunit beta 1